jgi:hypothetical protein
MVNIFFRNKNIICKLSNNVLLELEKMGYENISKYAEGSFSLVLKTQKNNKNYILLINIDSDYRENKIDKSYDLILKKQTKNLINIDYIIKCYNPIIIENLKLSDDENYENKNNYIYIEVEEFAEQILGEKIFELLYENVHIKVNFFIKLRQRIIEMYEYILSKKLYYSDLHVGNLAFRKKDDINTLIFIDVDSFEKSYEPIESIEDEIDYILYDMINFTFKKYINIINKKNESENDILLKLINSGNWDHFSRLFLDEEEKLEGLTILKSKINSNILFELK